MQGAAELKEIKCADLVSACAHDTGNTALWTEFLIRYSSRIRRSIRKASALLREVSGGEEERDLFQATIVRLVENNCAVMKLFSAPEEGDWLAYLAMIGFSVVRDTVRREHRLKRRGNSFFIALSSGIEVASGYQNLERRILASEIRTICERMMNNLSGERSARNKLIFLLYFVHDLSIDQIAKCEGLGLTKSGVQDVIKRLIGRVRRVVEDGTRLSEVSVEPNLGCAPSR